MPTKLDKLVSRETAVSVRGRPLVVTLDPADKRPVIRLRLKGHKSGWYAFLDDMIAYAVNAYPQTGDDIRMRIRGSEEELENMKQKAEVKICLT